MSNQQASEETVQPFRRQRMAWGLCVATWLMLLPLMLHCATAGSHGHHRWLLLLKPGAGLSLFGCAAVTTFCLIVVVLLDAGPDRWRGFHLNVAMLVSFFAYPAVVTVWLLNLSPLGACEWNLTHRVEGPGGQVFYVLHASPPMNGKGDCALARSLGSNPINVALEMVTDFPNANQCFHGREVLTATQRDPDPEVRRVGKLLVSLPARMVAIGGP